MLNSSIVRSIQSSVCGLNRFGGPRLPSGYTARWNSAGVDSIGVPVKTLPAITPIGTTYYLNTANTYNGNGLSSAPAVSAGQAGAFNSYTSAFTAINVAGGTLLILPGTHATTATHYLDKPALLESYSGNPADTILDFGASSGQFVIRDTTGADIFSKLQIKNSTAANGAIYASSALATDNRIVDCILKDNVCHAQALNSHMKVLRNKLLGLHSGDKALYLYTFNGNDYGHIVDFNVFAPSENYLTSAITVRSNQAAAATSKINNNIFLGSRIGSNIYVQKSGTVAPSVIGKNNAGTAGVYTGLSGITFMSGDLSESDLSNNITLAPQKTYSLFPDSTLGATVANHLSGEFGIKRYPRKALVSLSIDDTGAYNGAGDLNIPAIMPVLAEYSIKMTWFITVTYLNAPSLAVIKTWLDAGHEIGLHGYTHSNLVTSTTSLQSVAKSGASLTISITDSAANPKDWTGTVTITGGASVTIDGNPLDATNISTFTELKAWLIAQGCTVGADLAEFKNDTLAVALADQASLSINAATHLPMNSTRFKKVEITYGKYGLEQQVRTLDGYGEWECKSWGSPYEANDNIGMDTMKQAGLFIARAAINSDIADINQTACNVIAPLNIFALTAMAWSAVDTAWGSLKDSGTNLVTENQVYGHLTWLSTLGAASGSYMHHDSGTIAEFRILLACVVDMQNRGNLISGTFSEISDYIRANGTEIAGDGSGRQEQWYLDYDADFGDYELLSDSPCINAGVSTYVHGDGDQYDQLGGGVWSDTTNLPDGHWLNGVDIGPIPYGELSPVFLSLLGADGAKYWPSAPELIAVTGVDNAVFDALGIGKTFATEALALAALATVADDEKLFAGPKGAVLYSTDMSAKADKINRYLGNAV